MTTPAASLVQLFQVQQSHDAKLRDLQQGLSDAAMLTSFADVTRTYNLSRPLAAAFAAVPGFSQALKSFPKQELLNLVPEHPSSPSSVLALESFSEAESGQGVSLAARAEGVTGGFDQLLQSLGNTASSLREQIDTANDKLDLVDDMDELVAQTPVTSLSDSAYGTVLNTVSEHLGQVTHFNVDELRANPEKLAQEVEGLTELVSSLGPVLGFALGDYGLIDAERGANYQPGTASFVGMGLTKASLQHHLAVGRDILNTFDLLVQQRDFLVESLRSEAQAMPEGQATDEVTYGYEAHATLIGCYTSFITKLVMSGVYAISMLLQVADTVLAEMGH